MYGDNLLIKEKNERDSIVKIKRVEIKTLLIIKKDIEDKDDEVYI